MLGLILAIVVATPCPRYFAWPEPTAKAQLHIFMLLRVLQSDLTDCFWLRLKATLCLYHPTLPLGAAKKARATSPRRFCRAFGSAIGA